MGSRRSKIQPFQDMGKLGQQPGGGGLPGSHLCKALDCMCSLSARVQGARARSPLPGAPAGQKAGAAEGRQTGSEPGRKGCLPQASQC